MRPDRFLLLTVLALGVGLMMSSAQSAAQSIAPQRAQPLSKTGPAVSKALIVETVHPYTVRPYTPELEIPDKPASEQASFAHPESTMRAYFGAMKSRDYEAFIACWTSRSRDLMREKDKTMGRTPDQWKAIWQGTFSGKKVYATHWINYGKYVLVNYRVEGPEPVQAGNEAVAVLVQEDGLWKLTQELRTDPLPANWRSESGRIQVPADSLFAK